MFFRTSLIVGATAAVFALGCESAADQQRQANEAQADANHKAAEAQQSADKEMREAQAVADKKIADAQADFSKMREDFRHDLEGKVVEVDKEIDELGSKAKTSVGKKKAEIEANLPTIRQKRADFETSLKELSAASAVTWDQTKATVEKHWAELKDSVDKAS